MVRFEPGVIANTAPAHQNFVETSYRRCNITFFSRVINEIWATMAPVTIIDLFQLAGISAVALPGRNRWAPALTTFRSGFAILGVPDDQTRLGGKKE
jgi:hypothetical protein